MDRSNFTAELGPNTATIRFDTETDSDPDTVLASPLTFSDDL
ncbi:MAG: hypothetical protein ACOX52_18120 [Verrucomicrobiota bacterium]